MVKEFWYFTVGDHSAVLGSTSQRGSSGITYFASQAMGVKSSLCLVLKIMFLVRISRIAGGSRGVAMAKRASCGGGEPLSLSLGWRL